MRTENRGGDKESPHSQSIHGFEPMVFSVGLFSIAPPIFNFFSCKPLNRVPTAYYILHCSFMGSKVPCFE